MHYKVQQMLYHISKNQVTDISRLQFIHKFHNFIHTGQILSHFLLCSTVGGMPIFGRRTDPVLHSACSRRVTTMWVNHPLQVSQLGQLSLSSFRGRQMSSRPIYRCMLRWDHLVSAYGVTAGWRLCDRLVPFVLAAYARAKPSLLLYLACVPVLVSTVLHGSLLYVSM